MDNLINIISKCYSERTGLKCAILDYDIRTDLSSVLIKFGQVLDNTELLLTAYTRPNSADVSDPAMISLNPSDEDVSKYVSCMESALKSELYCRRMSYTKIPNPFYAPDIHGITQNLLAYARVHNAIYDESIAEMFVFTALLESYTN